jgi:hypothetical protein
MQPTRVCKRQSASEHQCESIRYRSPGTRPLCVISVRKRTAKDLEEPCTVPVELSRNTGGRRSGFCSCGSIHDLGTLIGCHEQAMTSAKIKASEMGHMRSQGKGMSGSALPCKRTPLSWLTVTSAEVRNTYGMLVSDVRLPRNHLSLSCS